MSRHLVDPQLVAALEMFAPLDMELSRIDETRAMFASMNPPVESYARPSVGIEKVAVPGPDGAPDVAVTLYRPVQAEGPLPVLLHIHGGGYLFGSAAGSGPANVRTASELQCVVAAVDYRLAPETRAARRRRGLLRGAGLSSTATPTRSASTRRASPWAGRARAAGLPRRWR